MVCTLPNSVTTAALALAAPAAAAAAAAAAYLNAKGSLFYDYTLFKGAISTAARLIHRERNARLNHFYVLESHALSPSTASSTLIHFEGRAYTYAHVYDTVLRYGAWLREDKGVKPGDIVAMDFQNSHHFVFVWFGLWSIGAKPAFLNYNLKADALAHCIRESTSALCLVDANLEADFTPELRAKFPDHYDFTVLTPDLEARIMATPPRRYPDEDRAVDDRAAMAILIYTSGTTGMPKAAIVSWAKCTAGAVISSSILGTQPSDTMFTAMPLYHSSAALLSFLAVLHSGATQGLGRKFSARSFWDDVRACDATMIQYVGETLRYLLAAPPRRDAVTGEDLDRRHRVRLAYGNGLRPDVWNRFKERFGIPVVAEMYSATEGTFATHNVSANDFALGAIGRTGWIYRRTVGRNLALVEVDWSTEAPARDPATGFCRRVPAGSPGEMLYHLPTADLEQRFQGYFNNPGATEKKILRDVFKPGDAWFRTGDVLLWDAEGRIYFKDRIGDTFRWKSENVSTAEVSEVVGLHPAVAEANVYGVELPGHDGRAGCAAVHVDASSASLESTMKSLAAHVRASLPRYAVPLFLRVRTTGGADGEPGASFTSGTMKQQKYAFRQAGVKPDAKADAEMGRLYWLAADGYEPFGQEEWDRLSTGKAKL